MDDGKHRKWRLATADDIVDSNGVDILDFTEADEKARLGPPGLAGQGKLEIVNDIMDYYMKQQRAEARSADRERDMTDERLKKRLPKIAIDKAERLNDTKYDR